MAGPVFRAVGYRRVSMREQVDGHSLDAQENHIRQYAHNQGWLMQQVYTDAGLSAKKDSERPALTQLLADAQAGQFDVIIVDKIDRFYRHLGGLLVALDQLNNCGVALVSVQEHLDFTTPWGKLMLTVLGTLAEIYIDNLKQETRKGKKQRAREGLWNGNFPFGYCLASARIAPIRMAQDTAQITGSPIRAMGSDSSCIRSIIKLSGWPLSITPPANIPMARLPTCSISTALKWTVARFRCDIAVRQAAHPRRIHERYGARYTDASVLHRQDSLSRYGCGGQDPSSLHPGGGLHRQTPGLNRG